jgi:hypothetical protein
VIVPLTAAALPADATRYEDTEELPDGVNFTYWTKALFGEALTGPSIFARVKPAVNVAPQAVNDSYSGTGTIAGNFFDNDTDADMGPNGKSKWLAVLTDASGVPLAGPPPGLIFPTLPGDGAFSYNTANGSITFYYRIDTGTWTDGEAVEDMSPDSNVAQVTISVPPPADSTAPILTGPTVTPTLIWSPNGKKINVTITGTASDPESGISKIVLDVIDEYKVDQPHMEINNPTTATFTFVVPLTASRNGNDKDGRKYTIIVKAINGAGLVTTATPLSVTAHDKSK